MDSFWKDRYVLLDLLFGTNLSMADIAKELGVSESRVSEQVKELGLDWVKRKTKKMSRGQSALTTTLQKVLPNEKILNEYHVGERLMLDVYCPTYKIGLEYHGRQHYEWVCHFHETYEDFVAAQRRDERKLELCAEQGITVLSFKYNDELTEDIVHARVLEAIQKDVGQKLSVKKASSGRWGRSKSIKDHPNYEEIKSRRREFAREARAKIREERKKQIENGVVSD